MTLAAAKLVNIRPAVSGFGMAPDLARPDGITLALVNLTQPELDMDTQDTPQDGAGTFQPVSGDNVAQGHSSREISAADIEVLLADVDRELAMDDADADFTVVLNNLTLAEAASKPAARGELKERRRAAFLRLDAYLRGLPFGDERRQSLCFLWYQFDADGSPKFSDRSELVDHLADFDDCTRGDRMPTDESFMNFVRASSGPGLSEADLSMLALRLKAAYVSRVVIPKTEKPGRNDPCPCGSGKKYKKCCGAGAH